MRLSAGTRSMAVDISLLTRPDRAIISPAFRLTSVAVLRVMKPGMPATDTAGSICDSSVEILAVMTSAASICGSMARMMPYGLNSTVVAPKAPASGIGTSPPTCRRALPPLLAVSSGEASSRTSPFEMPRFRREVMVVASPRKAPSRALPTWRNGGTAASRSSPASRWRPSLYTPVARATPVRPSTGPLALLAQLMPICSSSERFTSTKCRRNSTERVCDVPWSSRTLKTMLGVPARLVVRRCSTSLWATPPSTNSAPTCSTWTPATPRVRASTLARTSSRSRGTTCTRHAWTVVSVQTNKVVVPTCSAISSSLPSTVVVLSRLPLPSATRTTLPATGSRRMSPAASVSGSVAR